MNKETLDVVKVWDSIKEIKRIKGYNTVGIIGCVRINQSIILLMVISGNI